MPRVLPWLKNPQPATSSKNKSKKTTSSSPRPRNTAASASVRRAQRAVSEDDEEPPLPEGHVYYDNLKIKQEHETADKNQDGTKNEEVGSSPPPSSSLAQPSSPKPTPEAMLESDKNYIMVEDEFLSIAQGFTRRLHDAEYRRLKKLARRVGERAGSSTGVLMNELAAGEVDGETAREIQVGAKRRKIDEGVERTLGSLNAKGKAKGAEEEDDGEEGLDKTT